MNTTKVTQDYLYVTLIRLKNFVMLESDVQNFQGLQRRKPVRNFPSEPVVIKIASTMKRLSVLKIAALSSKGQGQPELTGIEDLESTPSQRSVPRLSLRDDYYSHPCTQRRVMLLARLWLAITDWITLSKRELQLAGIHKLSDRPSQIQWQ